MPQTRQTVVPINKDLSRLEALSQPRVAYGRDLEKGEVLPFHCHRRAHLVHRRNPRPMDVVMNDWLGLS